MQWFSDKRLFVESSAEGDEDDEWLVSDLRKIVFYLTVSVLDKKVSSSQNARNFLKKVVKKFSLERVKEFMEIQLMHHSELSLQLLDWLESEFENRVKQTSAQVSRKPAPEASIENLNVAPMHDTIDEEDSRLKLPVMPKVNLEELSNRSRQ